MTQEQLKERIAKKEQEIAKIEKRIQKHEDSKNETGYIKKHAAWYSYNPSSIKTIEDLARARSHEALRDRETYEESLSFIKREYQNYLENIDGEISRANYELNEAREVINKYQKQLEAETAKQNTLADVPEVLKKFREELIVAWDKYDLWKQEQIIKEYRELCSAKKEWREMYRTLSDRWGRGWYEFRDFNAEYIHKTNVTAADTLVMNLIDRTVEIAGKITDCQYLTLDRDNQGYSIINGIVIGEKGKARVESIGAGGYNIQRYHIRVLVKEVRA